MPLVILIVMVVAGAVALVVFRSRSLANDRRRQAEESNR
jgi:heme/copper-type cytochrome/quinol oxidase subunit 2